jgi:hypothetical protein
MVEEVVVGRDYQPDHDPQEPLHRDLPRPKHGYLVPPLCVPYSWPPTHGARSYAVNRTFTKALSRCGGRSARPGRAWPTPWPAR